MRLNFVLAAAFAMLAVSCGNRDYSKVTADPILYSKTVKKLNDIVLENNFPPMIAARNYVYANIAAYECIVAGDSSFQTLSGQIKHMPAMPSPEAGKKIDFKLAALLAFTKVGNAVTFPEGSMMAYYESLIEKAEDAGMPDEVLENTKAFSENVFSAIMEWSKKDNYAQTRSASKYTVTDEEGRWVPTPPSYTSALEAHWMEIRTLVLDSAGQCRPAPAPKFDIKDTSSVFYKATMEVKNVGENLTEEQKHIADFWDDNPFKMNVSGHVMFATKKFSPGGHWMNIVGIVADKAGLDFNSTVYAYAKSSIALFEAFISCWEEKFRSNVIRPETVINKYIDAEWRPYIQTPPFPSYTSGHSVISGAVAEVLTDIFGDNFSYTDTSEIEFGISHRSFTSFRQAALEASWSRMYGGIHYRFDLENGNIEGIEVGKLVVDRLRMRRHSNTTLTRK
jgi:hypothetical protein